MFLARAILCRAHCINSGYFIFYFNKISEQFGRLVIGSKKNENKKWKLNLL